MQAQCMAGELRLYRLRRGGAEIAEILYETEHQALSKDRLQASHFPEQTACRLLHTIAYAETYTPPDD